ISEHMLLALWVARNAAPRVRPGGTLLFMGGTGGRRVGLGLGIVSAGTAPVPTLTPRLALEFSPGRVDLLPARFVDPPLSAAVGCDPRRPAGRAPRAAPHDAAGPTRRQPGRHRRTGRSPHDEHGGHRRDLRHRRRPAAGRSLTPRGGICDPAWFSPGASALRTDKRRGSAGAGLLTAV